jgi:hypothetical protein
VTAGRHHTDLHRTLVVRDQSGDDPGQAPRHSRADPR